VSGFLTLCCLFPVGEEVYSEGDSPPVYPGFLTFLTFPFIDVRTSQESHFVNIMRDQAAICGGMTNSVTVMNGEVQQ